MDAVIVVLGAGIIFCLWLFRVAVGIPFERLMMVRSGIFPTKTYLEEVIELSSKPIASVAKYGPWVLTCIFTMVMYKILDWGIEYVPQLGPSHSIHWTAVWFLTLLPCAIVPPFWRRRSVLVGTIMMLAVELCSPRTTHSGAILLPPALGVEAIAFSLVGIAGAYMVAYGLDSLAYRKALSRPLTDGTPPVFDLPMDALRRLFSRK